METMHQQDNTQTQEDEDPNSIALWIVALVATMTVAFIATVLAIDWQDAIASGMKILISGVILTVAATVIAMVDSLRKVAAQRERQQDR